ncbi:MAG: hypothetical protein ACI9TV_000044 [Sulfurimonas sp.]|jgi:hypothetical protein|uniref:DUF3226 domain-containing protein n=1 Tax=Sulfurimonas sp. TaxID=2022749 RepID=UPI0039E5FDEA
MKKYLLVEGITDVAFVKYVCLKNNRIENFNDFEKNGKEYTFHNLVIVNMNGQGNLDIELSFLKDQDAKIEKIAIIEDADDDFKKSQEDIELSIKKSKIDSSKINYFLTPNNKDLGNLETLLLSTVQENNIVGCFSDYKKCLLKGHEIYPKALNKGQVYSYTMYSQSGKDLHKPQDSFISKKNEDTGLWDLTRPEFQVIIKFILESFK